MTRGETPHPYDYWAQPIRVAEGQQAAELLQEQEPDFVASLGRITEIFMHEDTYIRFGQVAIERPPNHLVFGLPTASAVVYLMLDTQLKAMTGGTSYLGIVSGSNFRRYGVQGPSVIIARGEFNDMRDPADYAPFALGMPINRYVNGYGGRWLPRLV